MQFLLLFTALLAITSYALAAGKGVISHRSIPDDLKSLNASCPLLDNCQNNRTTDSLADFACQCTAVCALMDTCCFDSPYRPVKPPETGPSCRPISNEKRYLMMDRCPRDSVWENLCKEEWNGDSDVQKIVPVTSLFTHMTYKNYFCFRCHETTDDFVYWNVELGSFNYSFDPSINTSSVRVTYFPRYRTWAAPVGMDGAMVPVAFNVKIPEEIQSLPQECELGVISHCAATWKDKDVINKCAAYMGILNILYKNYTSVTYRNAHCAVCNYEDLSPKYCKTKFTAYGAKAPFSFTHLLDVNRSDGDKVGKTQKCEGDSLWDPYANRCRELKCALPGYVVKEGKCTPP